MSGIFISYRRSDTQPWAGRLSDSLKAALGRVRIFRDIEDIPPGVNFEKFINDEVGTCDALIALIGPQWLISIDRDGTRRLDDPNDFTRLEIATALKRNVRVIPILVGGAQMPPPDALPEDLQSLARRQAYELTDARWSEDCKRLASVLKPIVKKEGKGLKQAAGIALALIAAAVISALWFSRHSEREESQAGPLKSGETQSHAKVESDSSEKPNPSAEASIGSSTPRKTGRQDSYRSTPDQIESSGKEAAKRITVSAASLCPDGYMIFYKLTASSDTGQGLNLPVGAPVCIVDSSIQTKSGVGVLVRDAKSSDSPAALTGPDGRRDKICRIMFDAIDKDDRNFNYPMGADKKPEDCAAYARVKQGNYGAVYARIGCGYTSYIFGAPFSIFPAKGDSINETAFKGLNLTCGWE